MAQQQGIQTPSGFGGIVRYNEEYESRFKLSPGQVIGFLVFIVIGIMVLKVMWPITTG